MTLGVCVAGATGWTGRPVAEAVLAADDLDLRSAVSRSSAGKDLGLAWGGEPNGVPVFGRVANALEDIRVLVDYTSHQAVRDNALAAIERGVSVVIGSSGLAAEDFAQIDGAARHAGVGVVAAGNFSLTAAMAQAAAVLVARYLPNREIIDYASAEQTGRAQRDRQRACRATRRRQRDHPGRPGRPDRRTGRGSGGHGGWYPDSLVAAAQLRRLHGGGLRLAR